MYLWFFYLFIHLRVYFSIYLCIHSWIYLLIYLCIYLFIFYNMCWLVGCIARGDAQGWKRSMITEDKNGCKQFEMRMESSPTACIRHDWLPGNLIPNRSLQRSLEERPKTIKLISLQTSIGLRPKSRGRLRQLFEIRLSGVYSLDFNHAILQTKSP